MDRFVIKDGKQLRTGWTTGSCAAAAAKAAAWLLMTGEIKEKICLITPNGTRLELPVEAARQETDSAVCAVRKDSGDDPDITNGTLIFAAVSYAETTGITIDGGKGVGRVTKPGLDQPVGAAAINSVPRKMIREAVEEVCRLTDHSGGLTVIISVPDGEALARKTFNPRLGIIGGISILGTSGIVEPMSEQALIDTIRIELRQRHLSGASYALLTPGNYGMDFIRGNITIAPEKPVMVSNFIGDSLDCCREFGYKGVLLIGHIGKLVKIAGNMMNTHSRYGDCRMEILAAYAGAAGLSAEGIGAILECVTCDEAVRILKENNCFERTMERLVRNIARNMDHRIGNTAETGAILFSKEYGLLCETDNAGALLGHITEE